MQPYPEVATMNAISDSQVIPASAEDWVRETRFGKWFVSTDIWYRYVLTEAVADLKNMLGARLPTQATLLDAGSGIGLSFTLLDQYFQPGKIVGLDIDKAALEIAAKSTQAYQCPIELVHGSASHLSFPDNSFDLIFCHQLIHHVKDQSTVLRELLRVLRPGGFLLSSESCRSFIDSFWVRLLFRHPEMVQKSAEEYVDLMRSAGFEIREDDIKTSIPWWSLVDFGLLEKLGFPARRIDATEILTVAQKP
jgi:ubiquinone/menaquinone biosynthesis C-methylase UbiE